MIFKNNCVVFQYNKFSCALTYIKHKCSYCKILTITTGPEYVCTQLNIHYWFKISLLMLSQTSSYI